jgi:hypothetical protein
VKLDGIWPDRGVLDVESGTEAVAITAARAGA